MPPTSHDAALETQIGHWRTYLRRRQAIQAVDVAELEDHLRQQIAGLADAGLATDEAFLVAVKRLGNLDALSREFAREHSDRLWKQLVVPTSGDEVASTTRTDAVVAVALAVGAAAAVKAPTLFGRLLDEHRPDDAVFYLRNASLFVLPFLAGYFVWKRQLAAGLVRRLVAAFLAAAGVANIYPLTFAGSTLGLSALHLPIALWLVVGVAYAGGRWGQVAARMDFVRFSGELFIYYVLIALGGGVFTAFTALVFDAIGIDVETFIGTWLVPCGAAGAFIIAAWLVEAKQSVIENMAPVLTRLFTPLFTVLLLVFLVACVWTGRGIDVGREVLIAFDLLLAVVVGLLLYAASARDPEAHPDAFDALQVALVVCALLANGVALWAIASRITEFGFTPNRVAALGENVILLVNLAWSAVLYMRVLRTKGPFSDLLRWQTNYLWVYAAWAIVVVVVFPPLFNYT
jgi:Domain of unknown function (DUF4153)